MAQLCGSYFVMMPDVFDKDPIPLNHPSDFDIMAWLNGAKHPKKVAHLPSSVDPIIETALSKMRSQYGIGVRSYHLHIFYTQASDI